ncbi:ubiquitin carboxyl-terminal hydrolase 5-like, partial [Nilaparvata lugens]|uniref:ubiquitin carboxyl-terminal hydrolase 5-like n=1 Tax=Nilaparvata lugens TaxID=108931 RepID=UPI00193E6B6F
MFKTLVGKGHPDFSTKKQQDVLEFLLHFITILQRNSRHLQDPSEAFKFQVEDRFQCSVSKKVKYTHRTEYCLPVPIPLEAALNKEEVAAWEALKEEAQAKGQKVDFSQQVRPHIKLSSCFDVFTQVENVEQFYSTA